MISPYYQDDFCTIYHGDAREILPYLPRIDCVITDPPFNVRKRYGPVATDNLPADEYYALLALIAQICDRQAWICPHIHIHRVFEYLHPAVPIVITRGAHGPSRGGWYDQFQLGVVRGRPLSRSSNLWSDIRLVGEGYFYNGETFGHPGTTPYAIMHRFIRLMAEPTTLILDPFLGTGTTLCAAKNLQRQAIGIEVEARWCEVAIKRLRQEVLPFEQRGKNSHANTTRVTRYAPKNLQGDLGLPTRKIQD